MIKSKKGSFFVKMKFYYKKFKNKKKYFYENIDILFLKSVFQKILFLNLKKYFSADFWKKHDFLNFAKKYLRLTKIVFDLPN